MSEQAEMAASAGWRLALLAESFERLAGEELAPGGDIWNAPRAIVAHGIESPPLFFYGNRLASRLFRMRAAAFIGLPSHMSAEPGLREARAAMLAKLEEAEMVRDYRGIRVASDGSRFEIEEALVWNLVDRSGTRHGQAATFAGWRPLAG